MWSRANVGEIAGGRLVPVETYADDDATSTYLSESWDRKVITLAEYIDRYVTTIKGLLAADPTAQLVSLSGMDGTGTFIQVCAHPPTS